MVINGVPLSFEAIICHACKPSQRISVFSPCIDRWKPPLIWMVSPWAVFSLTSPPRYLIFFKRKIFEGRWVAQSFKHPTLDFSPGPDLRVMRSSPELGSALSGESAWDSLSLCPSPCSYTLSFSKINNL